jgi:hypothetical protein
MSRSSVNFGSGPCCDQAAITSYPGSTPAQRHLTNLQCLTLRQWAWATEIIDSMLFVLPTTRVSVGGTPRRTGQSPRLKILLAYISWYINDYGPPWTSPDVNPRIRPNPGQIAGTGGVLLTTTEQKVFVTVLRSEPRSAGMGCTAGGARSRSVDPRSAIGYPPLALNGATTAQLRRLATTELC